MTENFGFNYTNESFADLFGYSQNDLVGNSWDCVIPEDVTEYVTSEFDSVMDESVEQQKQMDTLRWSCSLHKS